MAPGARARAEAKAAAYIDGIAKDYEQRLIYGWDRALGPGATVMWPGATVMWPGGQKPVIGKTTFRVKGEKK